MFLSVSCSKYIIPLGGAARQSYSSCKIMMRVNLTKEQYSELVGNMFNILTLVVR